MAKPPMNMADPDQASYTFNQCTARHQSPLLSNMKTLRHLPESEGEKRSPSGSNNSSALTSRLRHRRDAETQQAAQ